MLRSTNLEGFLVLSSYEVTGYVLRFHAKTARFCGSDSGQAVTMPVAYVRMKLVGQHRSILRSPDLEGDHVSISYDVTGYVLPFRAKNDAILRFGFLACRDSAGRLYPHETCR
jgi:hypothetical protein